MVVGVARPSSARADNEFVRFARYRFHQLRHERWNVAAITIEKHYDVIPRLRDRHRARACRARASVTTQRSYAARAGFTRSLGCAIGAPVINDYHFARHAGGEAFANHAGDRFLLV